MKRLENLLHEEQVDEPYAGVEDKKAYHIASKNTGPVDSAHLNTT